MKILERCKFRTQLCIYFFVTIAIVIVCLGGSMYFFLRRSYEQQEKRALTDQAKQIAINVDNRLAYYQAFMNLLMSDRNLIKKLESGNFGEISAYLADMSEEFMMLNSGRVNEINIYKEGYYDEKHSEFRRRNVGKNAEQFQRSEYVFSECYLNERNEKIFSIYKRIHQTNPDRKYYMEFRIYESELYSFFNEDKSGNDIRILNGEKIMSMSDRRTFLKDLLSGRQTGEKWDDEIEIRADSSNGWQVVIGTDQAYLSRDLWDMLRKMVPVIDSILAVTFGIVMLISNQLNRKLEALKYKVAAIGREECKEIEEPGLVHADEFKVLGDEIDHTREHINRLLREIEEKNVSKRTAEMVALRAQINSHFLFNALASLKWLTRSSGGQKILPEAIDELAVFLRYSVSMSENQVKLKSEVEQLNAYVYLQKLRCGDELNVTVDIEEELLDCLTVKLILQPLVENAVMHGRKENGSSLNITIYSYYDDRYYYLVVEDDGCGMTGERIRMIREGAQQPSTGGYGLKNVMSRIEICTEGEGTLTIESEPDKYTKIVIRQKRQ